MIKAIYLEKYPTMDNVGALEILSELNPLCRSDNNSTTILTGPDHKIYKDAFITSNYFITFYRITDEIIFLSTRKIYEIIQLSIPNFLKVMSIDKTLIIVIPKYSDVYENISYSVMIDELVRFTSWAYRKNDGDELGTSIMLKEYVEMCVSYPGNRSNSYKNDETEKN